MFHLKCSIDDMHSCENVKNSDSFLLRSMTTMMDWALVRICLFMLFLMLLGTMRIRIECINETNIQSGQRKPMAEMSLKQSVTGATL